MEENYSQEARLRRKNDQVCWGNVEKLQQLYYLTQCNKK